MINNKIFLILFSLLLISPLILATVGYSETDYGVHFESPKAPTNYSSVNVNNSATSDYATNAGQLETRDTATLYTYFKGLYDLIYCKLTGCTMAGDIDMGENDLDNVGDIEGGGTGSWFNESLLISGDSPISKDSNANLWIRAEVNYDACINLTEGSTLGMDICYLGSGGGGKFVIKNTQDGKEYMTIDRDSGNITFLNDTSFENVIVHNITTAIVTASGFRSTFGDGAMDIRGDPWYFSGADWEFESNVTINGNLTVVGNITTSYFLGNGSFLTDVEGTLYYSDEEWIIKNTSNGFNFNESKLSTIYYNASSVERLVGTDSGGDLGDIQTYNGVTYNITEVLSDFDLRVNFTGIEEFTTLLVRHKCSDDNGHVSAIQIWDYVEDKWEGYGYLTESATSEIKTLGVYDDTDHIQDGIVQVRFFQEAVGNAGHIQQFDWVAISKGYGTPVGEEIDPDFNRWLGNPKFEYNVNVTGYNITADYFLGDGSNLNTNSTTWWAGLTGWVSGWFGITNNELTFNETKLNETISVEGIRLGFNSTYNTTYDLKYGNSDDANFTSVNATTIYVDNIVEKTVDHEIVFDNDIDMGGHNIHNANWVDATVWRSQDGTATAMYFLEDADSNPFVMVGNHFTPVTSGIDLGTISYKNHHPPPTLKEFQWRNLYMTGDANIGGDALVTGNVTADYFKGDGSELTGIPTNDTIQDLSLNQTEADELYAPKGTAGNMVMKFIGGKFYMKVS